MNFPDDNEITLTAATIEIAVREVAQKLIPEGCRIKSMTVDASYGNLRNARITFTSDPEEVAE